MRTLPWLVTGCSLVRAPIRSAPALDAPTLDAPTLDAPGPADALGICFGDPLQQLRQPRLSAEVARGAYHVIVDHIDGSAGGIGQVERTVEVTPL